MSYHAPQSGWQPIPYGHETPHSYDPHAPALPPYGYRPPPGRPNRNNGVLIAVIIGTVLVVCTLLLTVVPFLFMNKVTGDLNESMSEFTGANTEEILQNELDVEFGSLTTDNNGYRTSGKLPVTFRNKGSERATFNVQIEAVDSSGNRIAEDTAYVQNLAPGQSVTEDVFTLLADDQYDDLAGATFKVAGITKY